MMALATQVRGDLGSRRTKRANAHIQAIMRRARTNVRTMSPTPVPGKAPYVDPFAGASDQLWANICGHRIIFRIRQPNVTPMLQARGLVAGGEGMAEDVSDGQLPASAAGTDPVD